MIAPATQTFRNAIKPIGETIDLSVYSEPGVTAVVPWQYDYDYELDANYVVTDLEVTKTVAAVAAGSILDVRVYRIPAGIDSSITLATTMEIAKCGFAAGSACGTKVKAGVLTVTTQPNIAVGTIPGGDAGSVTPTTGTEFMINATAANTVVNGLTVRTNTAMQIGANAAAAAGTTSKQRLRIIVSGTAAIGPAVNSFSCLINVSLCRISDFDLIQNGALARDNNGLAVSVP